MLGAEDFGDAVDAHFIYLSQAEAPLARAELLRALADGRWKRAPDEWMSAAWVVSSRPGTPWPLGDAVSALCSALCELPKAESAVVHKIFPRLINEALRGARNPVVASKAVAWFTQAATAGEAGIAATALMHVHDMVHEPCLAPLVDWLMDHGAAVLRTRQYSTLNGRIAQAQLEREPARLQLAFRFCVANEDPASTWFFSEAARFWRCAEHALESGMSATPILELLKAFQPRWPWTALYQPVASHDLPRSKMALIGALAKDAFPVPLAEPLWIAAFAHLDPRQEDVEVVSAAGAARGLTVLVEKKWEHDRQWAGSGFVSLAAWGSVLVASAVRAELSLDAIERLNQTDYGVQGVHEGLLAATEGTVQAVLKADGDRRVLARSALALLRRRPRPASPTAANPDDVLELVSWLTRRVVANPWSEPIAGVPMAQLLGRAVRLELADLDHEKKVDWDGGRLLLSRSSVEGGISGGGLASISDLEERHALASMYLLHELVHYHQGIGDKDAVLDVRAAGAETTLQHLDLSADHAAVFLAATVQPSWKVAWLKDVQARSLVAYPVGPRHTSASRGRKALRLVSLRLDTLARSQNWPLATNLIAAEDGYLYVDFAPGGGTLAVLCSRAPIAVLRRCHLTSADAAALSECADEGQGLEGIRRVDSVLQKVVAA